MLEIIFDSKTIDAECVFLGNNLSIDSGDSGVENNVENNGFRKAMYVKFEKNEKNFASGLKIMEDEMIFLKELTSRVNLKNSECWIKSYNGVLSDSNLKTLERYNEDKKRVKKSLSLTFNEKLKIDINNKQINIDEIEKICKNKIITANFSLVFYAIISRTKGKTNITIRLKVKEIKISEMKNHLFDLFEINQKETLLVSESNEFIKKYPTSGKKVVNNVLQLFEKQKDILNISHKAPRNKNTYSSINVCRQFYGPKI